MASTKGSACSYRGPFKGESSERFLGELRGGRSVLDRERHPRGTRLARTCAGGSEWSCPAPGAALSLGVAGLTPDGHASRAAPLKNEGDYRVASTRRRRRCQRERGRCPAPNAELLAALRGSHFLQTRSSSGQIDTRKPDRVRADFIQGCGFNLRRLGGAQQPSRTRR